MSQRSNGPVIALAIFALLAVGFGGATWFLYSNNSDLQSRLAASEATVRERDGSVSELGNQVESLKQRIGLTGEPDEVGAKVDTLIADVAPNATDLDAALRDTVLDRDNNGQTAAERDRQLKINQQNLQSTIAQKDATIAQLQTDRDNAEQTLRRQETQHSEELKRLNDQIADVRQQLFDLQGEYDTFRVNATREIADLEADIQQKRVALVTLRRRLFEQEDKSFDRPDGVISVIDHVRQLCYINLGSEDSLSVGTTFSVYTKSNNGVGRRNTEDIKAKIEVVNILEPHLAEARIVDQDAERPISRDDPIYSPLFTAGQQIRITVAGRLDFDGNPGGDRELFRRLVADAGAVIDNELGDDGEFISGSVDGLTYATRYLVIGDIGEDSTTQDPVLQALYRRIQENTKELQDSAAENGVREVNLPAFLEYIGYSRKRVAWQPPQDFPGKLLNGARSETVNQTQRDREASANVSSLFTNRRTLESVGNTTEFFRSDEQE